MTARLQLRLAALIFALALAPACGPRPYSSLSESAELSKQGKHDDAIAQARQALEINPRSEQAMYQLARRYAAAGDTQWALEYLARAIRRQPKQWKFEAASDAAFDSLRGTPAFQKLVAP